MIELLFVAEVEEEVIEKNRQKKHIVRTVRDLKLLDLLIFAQIIELFEDWLIAARVPIKY